MNWKNATSVCSNTGKYCVDWMPTYLHYTKDTSAQLGVTVR